jgi:hypothetical protein
LIAGINVSPGIHRRLGFDDAHDNVPHAVALLENEVLSPACRPTLVNELEPRVLQALELDLAVMPPLLLKSESRSRLLQLAIELFSFACMLITKTQDLERRALPGLRLALKLDGLRPLLEDSEMERLERNDRLVESFFRVLSAQPLDQLFGVEVLAIHFEGQAQLAVGESDLAHPSQHKSAPFRRNICLLDNDRTAVAAPPTRREDAQP